MGRCVHPQEGWPRVWTQDLDWTGAGPSCQRLGGSAKGQAFVCGGPGEGLFGKGMGQKGGAILKGGLPRKRRDRPGEGLG